MLWYKAWLETRSRFLVLFCGLTVLLSFGVLHGERQAEPWSTMSYYNFVLFANQRVLTLLWILAVSLLTMGGLLREQAVGASSFTLALPVSRSRLMAVRIGMGLIQALALAVVPSCAMYWVARTAGKAYAPSQLTFHLLLLLAGGSVFFAISVLISSLVEGEYTAPAVSLGLMLAIGLGLDGVKLRPYNPLKFMIGSEYADISTNLLIGSLPWINAVAWVLVAVLLLWIAVRAIAHRDF
jgi:ABC-type transport system involved in multi-copper enzyme maturation permease subunit